MKINLSSHRSGIGGLIFSMCCVLCILNYIRGRERCEVFDKAIKISLKDPFVRRKKKKRCTHSNKSQTENRLEVKTFFFFFFLNKKE